MAEAGDKARRAPRDLPIRLVVWAMVVVVALAAILLPLVDPSVFMAERHAQEQREARDDEDRFLRLRADVGAVAEVQAHRRSATTCREAVAARLPAPGWPGAPTLLQVMGADCHGSCAAQPYWFERMRERGLVLLRADAAAQPRLPDAVHAPACAAALAGAPSMHLLFDGDGRLFHAGERESRLKQRAWLPGIERNPDPNHRVGGNGISLLGDSGKAYLDEEAALIVTWERQCRWWLGQCIYVRGELARARRLDEERAEAIVAEERPRVDAFLRRQREP